MLENAQPCFRELSKTCLMQTIAQHDLLWAGVLPVGKIDLVNLMLFVIFIISAVLVGWESICCEM